MYWGFHHQCSCCLVKGMILYFLSFYCIYRFSNANKSPFQTPCLGFILNMFLKFRKFLPRYSYKINSYRKKSVYKAAQRGTREIIKLHSLTLHHAILIRILGFSPSIHVRFFFTLILNCSNKKWFSYPSNIVSY